MYQRCGRQVERQDVTDTSRLNDRETPFIWISNYYIY